MQREPFLPTISVITTCYNRATTIRACMENVLRQSYSAVEYVLWTVLRPTVRSA